MIPEIAIIKIIYSSIFRGPYEYIGKMSDNLELPEVLTLEKLQFFQVFFFNSFAAYGITNWLKKLFVKLNLRERDMFFFYLFDRDIENKGYVSNLTGSHLDNSLLLYAVGLIDIRVEHYE